MSRPRRWPVIAALFVSALLLIAGSSLGEEPSGISGMLRWKNGDELSGELIGGNASRWTYYWPDFDASFSVGLSQLQTFRGLDTSPSTTPAEMFRVELADGDVLFGSLGEITDDRLVLLSERCGEVNLSRSSLRRIVRLNSPRLVELAKLNEHRNGWRELERGYLTTRASGARLQRPFDLPPACRIDMELLWSGTAGFVLAYGTDEQLRDRTGVFWIDTWGDEIVVKSATRGTDFEPVRTLEPGSIRLRIQVLWDRPTGRLRILDEAGRELTRMETQTDIRQGHLFLENKGTDLTVVSLRVGAWDGEEPAAAVSGQDRVRTIDGRDISGQLTASNGASGVISIIGDGGGSVRFAPEDIGEIQFCPDSPRLPAVNCEAGFSDGTLLHGDFVSLDGEMLSLRTNHADEPISVRIERLRELNLSIPTADVATADHVLEWSGAQLHGTLAPSDKAIGFRPTGSEDVVPLGSQACRVKATNPAIGGEDPTSAATDVVYLAEGDQIPCQIASIDGESIHLSTNYSADARIPRDLVKALEFGADAFMLVGGFDDAAWQIQERDPNAVTRRDGTVTFNGRANLIHSEAYTNGSLEFEVEWNQNMQSSISVVLDADQGVRQRGSSVFNLNYRGDRMYVSTNSAMPQPGGQVPHQVISLAGTSKTRLRFAVEDNEIGMFVNGALVSSLPRAGDGGRIPAQAWNLGENGQLVFFQGFFGGNGPSTPSERSGIMIYVNASSATRRRVALGGEQSGPLLVLSNFRSQRGVSLFASSILDAERKERVLTVPRFSKHNPPAQLLVARNGDVLRGKLVSLGREAATFESGYETSTIPRDRLSGIIWLSKSESDDSSTDPAGNKPGDTASNNPSPSDEVPENTIQAVFTTGAILRLVPERVEGNSVVGRHPLLGKCTLPLDRIGELRDGGLISSEPPPGCASWTLLNAKEPIFSDASGVGAEPFSTFSRLVGKRAEDFSLALLDGQQFHLNGHRGKKIIVLDFWATWCGPCVSSFPHLLKALEGFSPDEVLFLAVNQREPAPTIQEFLKARGWDFQVALDRDGKVAQRYGVEGIPHTVVIDQQGNVARVNLGFHPELETRLAEVIRDLLDKRP